MTARSLTVVPLVVITLGCSTEDDRLLSEDLLPVDPTFDEDYVAVGDVVVTTLAETYAPRYGYHIYVDTEGASRVPFEDFGTVHPQPGEPHQLRDQLAFAELQIASSWTAGALSPSSRSLLYGFVFADPQYADTDSPALVAKNVLSSLDLPAFVPHWEFGPHLADALVRTVNRFQQDRRFDVAVVVGDSVENAQTNELQTHFTILNGGILNQDSGTRDDVVRGSNNDAFDPFIAEGLTNDVPWVAAIGNHDILINGNFPPGLIEEVTNEPSLVANLQTALQLFQLTIPAYPTADVHPAFFPHADRPAFRFQPHHADPRDIDVDETLATLEAAPIPADPLRAPTTTCEYVAHHREVGGQPTGHGFTAENESDCTGFFAYDPIPGLPVRILSLALAAVEGGAQGILAPPYLTPELRGDPRYDQVAFLEAELDRAEEEGFAVIVISHQASGDLVTESALTTYRALLGSDETALALWDRHVRDPEDPVTTTEFRIQLAQSPSVIAHLAGHNHSHRVRAVCPDGSLLTSPTDGRCSPGAEGQTGYWEITTNGSQTFPHQGRFFELVHVDGNLGALYLTVLDPRIPGGSFSERGRAIARAWEAMRADGVPDGRGEVWDRNLLLPLHLSDAIVQNLASAPSHELIESETTLLESFESLPRLPVWP